MQTHNLDPHSDKTSRGGRREAKDDTGGGGGQILPPAALMDPHRQHRPTHVCVFGQRSEVTQEAQPQVAALLVFLLLTSAVLLRSAVLLISVVLVCSTAV